MAITSGVGPHFAWIVVDGGTFPIEHGSVEQQSVRKSSTFSAAIPMSFPGALSTFAFLGDNTTSILVSTKGVTGTLVTGEIDDIDFDLIGRTIRVSGRDKAAKLHENMSSEKWQNKKGSDIVSDLVGRLGIGVDAATSSLLAGKLLQQDYVRLSDNISFASVIHKLAELDGAKWWVDNMGMFHYAMLGSTEGSYSLFCTDLNGHINSDCLGLRIKRNIPAGKSIQVSVKSWHPKDKSKHEYTSNVEGNGGPLSYNYHIPNLKQDHVQQHAKSRANEVARHELRLSASIVGDPTINVAMALTLTGTGYWDQTYEMDTIHHEFGMSGHRTNITARSAKDGRSAS